jgi:hypothetical protein
MPVIFTTCPQCERPLDLDLVRDHPAVACPCCDRRIDVPRPGLRSVPTTVWLASVLIALLPASLVPALLLLLPSEWYALLALVPIVGLLVFSVGILRSRRWAWITALVLGSTALLGAVGVGFLGLPVAFMSGSIADWVLAAASVIFVSGGLLFCLMLRGCRGWCDR